MSSMVLALGYNVKTNKIEQIAVGTKPWSGIRIYDLNTVDIRKLKLDNVYIDFNRSIVINNNKRLTKYSIHDGTIIDEVNHILYTFNYGANTRYMVTNGLEEPYWIDSEELANAVRVYGFKLSNAKLTMNDSEYTVEIINDT